MNLQIIPVNSGKQKRNGEEEILYYIREIPYDSGRLIQATATSLDGAEWMRKSIYVTTSGIPDEKLCGN